jgi:putative Mn2+ efflux pump MntP
MAKQSNTFKWIFNTVLTLTIVSLAVSCGLSFFTNPSSLQTSLFETCTTTWKMGFGAIVGLIGGSRVGKPSG